MDSAVVNKEIKTVIRPDLREAGFARFTARTAWRYSPEKIDVVSFQSFNSYLADCLGCTTYSFCLRLGCSFAAIPRKEAIKRRNGSLRPEEYECHFRRHLEKSVEQPNLTRGDVWVIDPDGDNLGIIVADARKAILDIGLPWFGQFSDMNEVLRTLLEESESDQSTSGFGADPSPARDFMTGFVAFSLGKTKLARDRIGKALDSGCFKEFEGRMQATLGEMESKELA